MTGLGKIFLFRTGRVLHPAPVVSPGLGTPPARPDSRPFHVAPEAADGGPIAALKNGDTIVLDVDKRRLDVEVSAPELKRRLKAVKSPRVRYSTGVMAKYARLVSSASEGAVTG